MAARPEDMGVIPVGAGEARSNSGAELRSTAPGEGKSSYEAEPREPRSKYLDITKWDTVLIEGCSLCRNHVLELCKACQATDLFSDEDREECSVAYGACNHSFHFHCLRDWLKTHSACPLDGILWEYQWYAR